MMKIGVLGAGYVGLVSSVGFAEMGNQVVCADINAGKINLLNDHIVTIYEPGLKEMIISNSTAQRLSFSSNLTSTIKSCDILFIAVGTPAGPSGEADLNAVFAVAKVIGQQMDSHKTIVVKSTVPIGTGQKVKELIYAELKTRQEELNLKFNIISNPEFLKEGAAINDFMKPDRIVIGYENDEAKTLMQQLYTPFTQNGHPILFMDICSAEMTKYASNAMLATKISFINEVANLCEQTGADISMVRKGMGSDSRIGPHFIYPGLGYGGSCFPKDISALIAIAHRNNTHTPLLEAVEKTNQQQRALFSQKIIKHFNQDLTGLTFAIWGLAFKPLTNDTRKSPAIDIISDLIGAGANVKTYDPAAQIEWKDFDIDPLKVQSCNTPYEALEGCDALALLTEWREFREPNFTEIKKRLKNNIIFDGRNQYSPVHLKQNGFKYISIGRAPL